MVKILVADKSDDIMFYSMYSSRDFLSIVDAQWFS